MRAGHTLPLPAKDGTAEAQPQQAHDIPYMAHDTGKGDPDIVAAPASTPLNPCAPFSTPSKQEPVSPIPMNLSLIHI